MLNIEFSNLYYNNVCIYAIDYAFVRRKQLNGAI